MLTLRFVLSLIFLFLGFSLKTNQLFAQCSSQNITVRDFYFADNTGTAFDSNVNFPLETIINGQIWATFSSRATNNSGNGYSLFVQYEVFLDNVSQGVINKCLFDGIRIPINTPVQINTFFWPWGKKFELKNFSMRWVTSSNKSCPTISEPNSQCWESATGFLVRTPLVANFTYEKNCDNLSVKFKNLTTGGPTDAYSYTWKFVENENVYTSTEINPIYNYSAPGNYEVTLKAFNGVQESEYTQMVVVDPILNLNINSPGAICEPNVVDLTDPAITSGSSNVHSLAYFLNSSATIPLANPSGVTQSGTYYIKATSLSGCSVIKPVTVLINPIPSPPSTSGNLTVCKQNPIQTLDARSAINSVTGVNVLWYDAAVGGNLIANPILNSVGSLTYYAEAVNPSTGCISSQRTPVTLTIDDCTLSTPLIDLVKSGVLIDHNGNGIVDVGDKIEYTFTIKNIGNVDLENVTLFDTKVTLVGNSIPILSVNQIDNNYSAEYILIQEDIDAGFLKNEAEVEGSYLGTPVSDESSITVYFIQSPSLSISKTAYKVADVAAGDLITYTYVVTNTGNVTLNTVSVTDVHLGLGALSPITPDPVDGIAPGQTVTFTSTYLVTQGDIDKGLDISNTATATAVSVTGGNVIAEATETIELVTPLVSIEFEKVGSLIDVNSNGIDDEGDRIDYVLTVQNTGNVTLTGIRVTDPLFSPAVYNIPDLPPGVSIQLNLSYLFDQIDIDAGFLTNEAEVIGSYNGTQVSEERSFLVTFDQLPSLSISKTADKVVNVAAGDLITYTFEVENTGNVTLTDIRIEDEMVGLSDLDPTSVAILAPNAKATFTATYTATQSDVDLGTIDNTAIALGNFGTIEVSDTTSISIPSVVQIASLELVKRADKTTFQLGDAITYTFEVENTGNVTLTDIRIEDEMVGLSDLDPTSVAILAPNAKATFTATYTATQSDVDLGTIDNTAIALGNFGTIEVSDTTSISIPSVVQIASLELVKRSDKTTFQLGDAITYTFEVENTGNVTLTDLSIEDKMQGLSAISPLIKSSLAPNEKTTFTATYTATQSDVDFGKIDNTAIAIGNFGTIEVSDTTSVSIPSVAQMASLQIIKRADKIAFQLGDAITYTFEVENTGNVTLTDLSIDDEMEGLSAISPTSVTSLAPNEKTTFTATYTATQADVDFGKIDNTAIALGNFGTIEVSDTTSVAIPSVAQMPSLQIIKRADKIAYQLGDKIAYTFEVENTGNVTLTDLSIDDEMEGLSAISPTSVTSLAPNEKTTFTATYTATQADVDFGKIDNTAIALGNFGTIEVSDTTSVSIPSVAQMASLQIIKRADKIAFQLGDEIAYTFEVENTGNVTLTDISIDDEMEGLSAVSPTSVASLAPNTKTTFTATYTATQADVDFGKIDNTAIALGNFGIIEVSDTTSVAIPSVAQIPSLQIIKRADKIAFQLGDEIAYTFEVENTGNVTLTDLSIEDEMEGLSAISPASVASLAPNTKTTFTATYTSTQSDVDFGKIDNTAIALGNFGTIEVSDTTSVSIQSVAQMPSLQIIKRADKIAFQLGDEIAYTFEVENTGNVTLTDLSIEDKMEGLSAISPASVASLAPNTKTTFTATYTATQADVDFGKIDNTAIALGNFGTIEVSDTTSVSIPSVAQMASLQIIKRADKIAFQLGDEIAYTFEVENTGNVTLTDLSIDDEMEGLSAISPTSVTSLAPNEKTTFTATYTATQADVDFGKIDNTAIALGNFGTIEVSDTTSVSIPSVAQMASLQIIKRADKIAFQLGDEIAYTFEVENTGNVTLTDISIEDKMEGLSAISPTSVTSLAPNEKTTFTATYTATQADVDFGKIDNTAIALGNFGTIEVSDTTSISIPSVVQIASLELVKRSDKTTFQLGDAITYTFEVENTGNVTLTDIRIEDEMVGLSDLDPTSVAILAPNAKATFTATYTATQSDVDLGTIDNTAIALGNFGTIEVSDTTSVSIPSVAQMASLQIIKRADKIAFQLGDEIAYTFEVENTGNVTLTDISIEDKMEGLSAISPTSVTSLAPNEKTTFTATYTATQADVDFGKIDNTAIALGNFGTIEVSDTTSISIPSVVQIASLELVKRSDKTTFQLGDAITYTFEVENTGNVTLTDIRIEDEMVGLSDLDPTSVAILAPNAKATFTATYTATQSDVDLGTIDNTAIALGNFGTIEVSDTTSISIPSVVQIASLELVKRSDKTTFQLGDAITYTFEVENTGNVTLTDIRIEDLMVGLSAISPTSVAILAPNAKATFTATYTATQSDVDLGTIDNTAIALGNFGTIEVSDTTSISIPSVVQIASLQIIKRADKIAFQLGDEIAYTFEVENTGNVTLTDIHIEDEMVGLSAISPTSVAILAPNAKATFTATYTATQSDVDLGTIDNTAIALGNFGTIEVSDTTSISIPSVVQIASLELVKRSDKTTFQLGDAITYTFEVENTGNVTLTDIRIEDEMVGLSDLDPTSVAILAPNAKATFTATYTATQSDVDLGTIDNTAIALGNFGTIEVSDTTSISIPSVVQIASLELVKRADKTTFQLGDAITYTFEVENTGNVTLTDIRIEDEMVGLSDLDPTSVAILAPNAKATFTATYTATQSDVDLGTIDNTAIALGNFGTIEVSDTTSISIPSVVQIASLELVKRSDKTTFQLGDAITYTFEVENTGNVTLTDIHIEDEMVGLSDLDPTSVASLAPNAKATFTATYTATQSDVDLGTIDNTAIALGNFGTIEVSDTTSISIPSVVQIASLELVKRADKTTFLLGDAITYTFEVENTGNVTLTDIRIEDLMVGLSAISPTSVASLTPNIKTTFTATYTATQSDVDLGKIENTAEAKGLAPDGSTVTSNSATSIVPANQTPSLSLSKAAFPTIYSNVGEVITYTFEVKNTGNVTIEDVDIQDSMLGLSPISPVAPLTSPVSLAPGEDATFTAEYIITQADLDAGSVINSATAEGETVDGSPVTSLSSTSTILANQTPSLSLSKAAFPTIYSNVGEVITYTFEVKNTGNVTLTDIRIEDLMVGLSAISPTSIAKLSTGEKTTFTANYSIQFSDLATGFVSNEAEAKGVNTSGTDVLSNKDLNIILLDKQPKISIEKIVDASAIFSPQLLHYDISVKNEGNIPLTGVIVKDILPNGNEVILTPISGMDLGIDIEEHFQISYYPDIVTIGKDIVNRVYVTTNEGVVADDDAVTKITNTKWIGFSTNFFGISNSSFLKMPNVFTPNFDLLNDYFFPQFKNITELEFWVMNKWGELIFYTNDLNHQGWDGFIQGKEAPVGNYVYRVKFKDLDGNTYSESSTFLLRR
jgi:gliding motility-associated-like protein/uncharacterized repeat protein (TIGR01451 family)